MLAHAVWREGGKEGWREEGRKGGRGEKEGGSDGESEGGKRGGREEGRTGFVIPSRRLLYRVVVVMCICPSPLEVKLRLECVRCFFLETENNIRNSGSN